MSREVTPDDPLIPTERKAQSRKDPRLHEKYNWFHRREHAGRVTRGHRGRKPSIRHAYPERKEKADPETEECLALLVDNWKARRPCLRKIGKFFCFYKTLRTEPLLLAHILYFFR
jgi:hypothetical protein